MKILIVDDDPQSLSSTSRILEHARHEVMSVSSGIEALQKLSSNTNIPDLIITDVRMPGMS